MFNQLREESATLYKEENYDEALKRYEKLKELDQAAFEKTCLFNYMWCLYRVKINREEAFLKENLTNTRKYVDYIMNHQSNKDMIFQLTILKVLKFLKSRPNFDAERVNTWLDKLDPNILSNKVHCYEYEGKQKAYPSNREEWYALKSKACEKLEMYSECLRVSEEALNIFKDLHNNNGIWFKRRIAISKHNLGKSDEAISILKDLLKYKKDWFFYSDISNIYYSLNDYENALNYGLEAILRPSEDDKKVNLFWNIGLILISLGDGDGNIFKSYSVKLRLINGWKLSSEEKFYYESNKDLIDSQSNIEMRKKIQNLSKQYRWKNEQKHTGVISNILPNGKAGFIKNDSGSYYFRINELRCKKNQELNGRKVEFYLESGFDVKKNIETKNAININFSD